VGASFLLSFKGALSACRSLTILSLYDNQISNISGLETCIHLEKLYLQNNCIREITGLENLKRLLLLNLSRNRIQFVSGLKDLESLQHLLLEKQKVPQGGSLTFESTSLSTLRVFITKKVLLMAVRTLLKY
jgi:Leucine-rich repeat (LRR) protein